MVVAHIGKPVRLKTIRKKLHETGKKILSVRGAFTLVELLVVIASIAILAAMLLPALTIKAATDLANGQSSFYWTGGVKTNPDFFLAWDHYRFQTWTALP